jgi:hypothetical protein
MRLALAEAQRRGEIFRAKTRRREGLMIAAKPLTDCNPAASEKDEADSGFAAEADISASPRLRVNRSSGEARQWPN